MDSTSSDPVQTRLKMAVRWAREAGDLTLDFFRRSDLAVEFKADASPVTAADRAAEELLRKRIAERFPEDSILGEEFGPVVGTSGYQWVLDPIDGTKSFVHGVPLYTTLVAVLAVDHPKIGVIYAPAADEMVFAAEGGGCWHVDQRNADGAPTPARVSAVRELRESLFLTTEAHAYRTARKRDALPVYLELMQKARLTRTWGDGFGYLLVATGRAEVMIDPVMNLWDAAPLQTVIQEAGGRFTDWQGTPSVHSGESVATNGLVAEEVIALTKGH
jgi:histidinol phosphatase-like enzyme (inositol monophosphatase family)